MVDNDVYRWSVDDVQIWLHQNNGGLYVDAFYRNRIDGVALCDLSKDKFDTLTRTHMGRDDRASMLWRNINSIKSRRSKPGTPKRKPPNHAVEVPPEPPRRDYDRYPGDCGELYETPEENCGEIYDTPEESDDCGELYETPQDDDLDSFTDDDDEDDDVVGEDYIEPDVKTDVPPIPSRPKPSTPNSPWGPRVNVAPPPGGLTSLQKGLIRKLSERKHPAVKKPPAGDNGDLYLAPNEEQEEQELYDIPAEEHGETYEEPHNDNEIYDIPDDGMENISGPRQPPSQQKLGGGHQMPRLPTSPARKQSPHPSPVHSSLGRDRRNEGPPIPSRVPPSQLPLRQPPPEEDDQEYTSPDDLQEEYMVPQQEEEYLEPGAPQVRKIQSRELPRVPRGHMSAPSQPEKPNSLRSPRAPPSEDVPPAIPSRPWEGAGTGLSGSSIHNKLIPSIPNGAPLPSLPSDGGRRIPPPSNPPPSDGGRRIPLPSRKPDLTNNNENENSNASNVKSMRSRFESDNSKDAGSWRKPVSGSKPSKPSPVIPRAEKPRTPGKPGSTSSTISISSDASFTSSGSDSVPLPRRTEELAPPPPSTRRPPSAGNVLPSMPSANLPSELKIADRPRMEPPLPQSTRLSTPTPPALPVSPTRKMPSIPSAKDSLDGYPWFHANISRDRSGDALTRCKKDGAFIVRRGTKDVAVNPYSLSIWYSGRVRNLRIRCREEDGMYALGTKKDNEMAFETPAELIKYHMSVPLILAGDKGKTVLTMAAPVFR